MFKWLLCGRDDVDLATNYIVRLTEIEWQVMYLSLVRYNNWMVVLYSVKVRLVENAAFQYPPHPTYSNLEFCILILWS